MHANCCRTVLWSAALRVPRGLCIMQRIHVDHTGEFRLQLVIVCGGMLQILLPVMAAPKSLKKSAVYTLRCTVLVSSCFNITTTVVLATNNRGVYMRTVTTHLACTIIPLAKTSFDFISLNGC